MVGRYICFKLWYYTINSTMCEVCYYDYNIFQMNVVILHHKYTFYIGDWSHHLIILIMTYNCLPQTYMIDLSNMMPIWPMIFSTNKFTLVKIILCVYFYSHVLICELYLQYKSVFYILFTYDFSFFNSYLLKSKIVFSFSF